MRTQRATASAELHRVPVVPSTMDAPYTTMQTLTEDPGNWMACILDVGLFCEDIPLQCYMSLPDRQGTPPGTFPCNAAPGLALQGPAGSAHPALRATTRPEHPECVVRTVLQGRGIRRNDPERQELGWVDRPPAHDETAARRGWRGHARLLSAPLMSR
jgi:hypothetical protein